MLSACSRQPHYPPAPQIGTNIAIEMSMLESEVPKFYTYPYHGKNINFFILKLHDKVLSFLDACVSCYPHKLGYAYGDGLVTCRACGLKFSIYKLEKGLGNCFPIKIEGRLENGKYLIPVTSLEASAEKF